MLVRLYIKLLRFSANTLLVMVCVIFTFLFFLSCYLLSSALYFRYFGNALVVLALDRSINTILKKGIIHQEYHQLVTGTVGSCKDSYS